ncbi:AAA domain-containing protein [Novipirellula sp. SH528]|uniref:AAA domain-containing protein n=1 Tax=Novipirellula sp. SH528 TaxID=3454466 RepID=UPI003FA051A8
MSEGFDESESDDDAMQDKLFRPARFVSELDLPSSDDPLLKDAATAIRQEFRDCSKWKRLRCRRVSIFAERDRGVVCVIHLGSSVEFDWTWEGAKAFRPKSFDDDASDFAYEQADVDDGVEWSGEILEVDERNGCLFVSLDNPEAIPTTGSFFVRPFEFLSVLDAVYNAAEFAEIRNELPGRLNAAQGNVHPAITTQSNVGLTELRDWWQHAWSILWGPPGTGKTYTTGQQIAAVLDKDGERILVVSTTNRATDAVALSIGNATRSRSSEALAEGRLLRIGKGASLKSFAAAELDPMLQGTESEVLHKIDNLAKQLRQFDTWEDKALTRKQIGELRAKGNDQSRRIIIDPEVQVVVATAFKATSFLRNETITKILEAGEAPFTTIFIDEAGLMSRTAIAALSLLASRRVVLVGDSKQLAPISRISRILPTRQQTWLASSGLSHLEQFRDTPTAVHVLSQQRRMHPDVCNVVSEFQYGGFLSTAQETKDRVSQIPSRLADHSRAIWYVLDEEPADLAAIRAQRGTGNKSWVRSITPRILQKMFVDPEMRSATGLFISPYKAQAQVVGKLFAAWDLAGWEASTVHSQQGSEADIVIFDTVNAGSYNWPYDEWKRLVNVALSRAREAVIVLASRSEMEEPYLKPLKHLLTPSVLKPYDDLFRWERVSGINLSFSPAERGTSVAEASPNYETPPAANRSMGHQVANRKGMKPVLSEEQQRLTNLNLDGKPRLVRGVAGSGKSIVLCNWLAKTVKRFEGSSDLRIWAVYANRSLHKLLRESIESAWESLSEGELFPQSDFPWDKVHLLHVKDVLSGMLPNVALSMDSFDFDYDRAAEQFLSRQDASELLPRCSALFIDEAQDMGPSVLKLLLSVVEQTDAEDSNSRSAHIFYDNAQNIYGRKTPKWSDFGLDMRGRSTIMRESFRSTAPIAELAVNVLQRLTPRDQRQDQSELLSMGLLERTERNGHEWLHVRFNQIEGPKPIFHAFDSRTAEIEAIATHLKYLIQQEGMSPNDICLLYNGKSVVSLLQEKLAPLLVEVDVELSVQTNRPFERQANTLIVTTSHSYKGYESEVVMIPCADQFVTGSGDILARNLYVAMTRARSLLALYCTTSGSTASRRLCRVITHCVKTMNTTPEIETSTSDEEDQNDILEVIGMEHRHWLVDLWSRFKIRQEPIIDDEGTVMAEPLFWFNKDRLKVACFGAKPLTQTQIAFYRDRDILVLAVGADVA